MKPLDEAVALRAPDFGGAMLDVFELQKELIRMVVGPATELASVVAEHGFDAGLVLLEERQYIGVQDMHRGHGLKGSEPF